MKLPTTPKFVASSNGTKRTNSYSAPPPKPPPKPKFIEVELEEYCLCRVLPIQFVRNPEAMDWAYVPRVSEHMLEDAIKDFKCC